MSKIIQIFKCKKQVTGVAPTINTTNDNWELINISSSEGGGSSIEISQDVETDKLSTDKVPSTKAVFDFMPNIRNITGGIEIDTGRFINGKKLYRYYAKPNSYASHIDIQADVPIYIPQILEPKLPRYVSLVNIQWHIVRRTTNSYNYTLLPTLQANSNDSEIKIGFNVNEMHGRVQILIMGSKSESIYLKVLPGSYIEYTKDDDMPVGGDGKKIYEGTEYQVINNKTQEPINPKNKVLLYTIDITYANTGSLTHKMKWTPSNPAMTNDNGAWGDAFFALGGMWNTRKAGEMIITKVDGTQFTIKGWYNNLIDDPYNQPKTTILNETKKAFFFVNTIKKIKPGVFNTKFEDDTYVDSDYNYVYFNWMPNTVNSLIVSPKEWSFSERADTYKIKKVEIYLYEY